MSRSQGGKELREMGKIVQYRHPITWGEVTSTYPVSTLESLGVVGEKGEVDPIRTGELLSRSPEHKERLQVWMASYMPNLEGRNAPLYCKNDPVKLGIRIKMERLTFDGKAVLGHIRGCATCLDSWVRKSVVVTKGRGEIIMPCGHKIREKEPTRNMVKIDAAKLGEHVSKCPICSKHKNTAECSCEEMLEEAFKQRKGSQVNNCPSIL